MSNYENYRTQVNFIKKYRAALNAATGSEVDANANVENKNVATMGGEMPKRMFIGTNRLLMHDKLEALFSKEFADEYIRQLESHEIYKHDETSPYPYTYGAHEVVNVRYKGHLYTVGMGSLYELCESGEVLLDRDRVVYGKYPIDMFIKDRNGWTRVERLIRKKRHRPLVRVKTAFNNDIIVTDNHPLIVEDDINNTVDAASGIGYKQYITGNDIRFWGETTISVGHLLDLGSYQYQELEKGYTYQRNSGAYIHLADKTISACRDLGYFVGFFVGDGYYTQSNLIGITQNSGEALNKIKNIGVSILGSAFSETKDGDKVTVIFNAPLIYTLLHDYFKIKKYSNNVTLPCNIMEFNKDFAIGVVEGLIDSDGTINYGAYNIRISSREAIGQLSSIINALGIPTSMTEQQTKFGCNELIEQKYQLFGLTFREPDNKTIFHNSIKAGGAFATKSKKLKVGEWINIDSVKQIDNEPYLEMNDFIYDITTTSHTFICNGIWVHNCVSITMYPFLFNGLSEIGGVSKAPTNLQAFCGSFINLVFAVAAQFAGAVATPEFLTYMDYFIRLEFGDNYYKRSDSVVYLTKNPGKTLKAQGFSGRTIDKIITDYFEQVVYSMNQPAAARNSQSVFWNIAYFDKPYFDGIFEGFVFPDGSTPLWESVSWLQKRFMEWFNRERLRGILTFPVETVNLLNDGEDFVDQEWFDFAAEMYSKGHSFFLYTSSSVDSLASCCRLRNGITDNTFSYTLGAGGISTGSKSVMTINLNRLVQNVKRANENATLADISEAVRDQVKKIHKYQTAFNEIMKDNFNARLLPVYDAGFISLEKQYLTIGI